MGKTAACASEGAHCSGCSARQLQGCSLSSRGQQGCTLSSHGQLQGWRLPSHGQQGCKLSSHPFVVREQGCHCHLMASRAVNCSLSSHGQQGSLEPVNCHLMASVAIPWPAGLSRACHLMASVGCVPLDGGCPARLSRSRVAGTLWRGKFWSSPLRRSRCADARTGAPESVPVSRECSTPR